ncbi:MAG TPA: ELWxxDGT repeat protein, partial [Thermoanaerobaculia bacterium]|nr:ELWxxDGT repeat protein [Thermoanaerobaculia bacterium]
MPRSAWCLILLLVALAVPETLLSQPAFLVEDLRTDPDNSSFVLPTQEFTALGTTVFFLRDDRIHGIEIWKSDGTQAGTSLLIDLCPGSCSSTPRSLHVSNGALFFIADDGARGLELWKSDGTAAGTVLVKDVYPGSGNPSTQGSPGGLLDVDGVVYFAANDGVHGQELWKSDGTAAGTVLVKDVNPGPEGSHPRPWAANGNTLLFNADDGTHGREPWVGDGTEAGTVLVEDINPGTASSSASSSPYTDGRDAIAAPGGGFLFRADDGTHGSELWITDGTPAGTSLLKDIHSTAGSNPTSLAALGSAVYFAASDGTNGTELWKTDGTEAGTVLVKDIQPGSTGSSPREIVASGSRIFFRAFDETHGTELWSSDGTAAGTVLVKDIVPGASSGLELFASDDLHGLTPFEGGVLFFGGLQLWRSDGTEDGTVQVSNLSFLNQPAHSNVRESWALAGSLFFFSTTGGVDAEPTFWKSDGTSAGTSSLLFPQPLASSITPNFNFLLGEHSFAEHEGRLLFVMDRSVTDQEVWTSDATPAGTTAILGIQLGISRIKDLTPATGGPLFFYNSGFLFKTDGTPAGTGYALSDFSSPGEITAVGSSVFFSCADHPFTFGQELCVSDGTLPGTAPLKDIRPGGDSSFPTQLTASGGALFFRADDGTTGSELWKSDGTEAGTALVKDVWDSGDSHPDRLTDVDGTLFFSAFTPGAGRELWKSDGTEAGTVLVKDIRPGADASIQVAAFWGGFTAAVGETLFFVANDGVHGAELWKSDGTAAGTVMVSDVAPGIRGSGPFWLARVGGRVYFSADDGVHGRELWVSDGTEAGTRLVADLRPGEDSSGPASLTAVGHTVVFSATDGAHGVEMWRSNGTASGTRMIEDIAPGTLSASPVYFTSAGSYVFFAANDNATGIEPWAVPRSAVLQTFADIPADFWAWPFVEALAAAGLTTGCAPGQFCPGSPVSRAEIAIFLTRGTRGPDFVPPPATGTLFEDVPAGHWAASWIEQLAQDGFTGGCNAAPPLYCPGRSLTRAEMAIFLLRAKHGSNSTPPPATGTVFTDIPAGFWAGAWIEQLAAEVITLGCAPGL